MYVCMYACMYVCLYVYMYICQSVCIYVCISTCTYACIKILKLRCTYAHNTKHVKHEKQLKVRLNFRTKIDRFLQTYIEFATVDFLKQIEGNLLFFCKFSFSIEKINLD